MKRLIQSLFNDTNHDIEFHVHADEGRRVIRAHRIYLTAVCKKITDFIDEDTESIHVYDTAFPIFDLFTRYLYESRTEVDAADAIELYKLADRYGANDLGDSCLSVMVKHNIEPDFVYDWLEFATVNGLDTLRKDCEEYIAEQADYFHGPER